MSAVYESVSTSATRVLWVHNTPKKGRMFLWDILEAMPEGLTVEVTQIPLRPSILSLIRHSFRIRKLSEHYDVVHAQFGSLVGLSTILSTKPVILSLRGTDFYALPSRRLIQRLEARFRQLASLIACWHADIVIVMSDRMKHELRKWPLLKHKRIFVVTDPVGEEFLLDSTERKASRSFSVAPISVFVGSLSADNPVKRIWLVERAVNICKEAGFSASLRLISNSPRSEVRAVMQSSDLVALTSTYEGWPNVIKEAISLGIPFIATDVSDLKHLCYWGSPNRIIDADELDIALGIFGAAAQRDTGSLRSEMFCSTVAFKHKMIYIHAVRT